MDILFDQKTRDIDFVEDQEGFVDLQFINDTPDKLMQRLYISFKTFIRDLWWNPTAGTDWLSFGFGINKQKVVVDRLVKNIINNEPLVKEIISFSSEVDNYNYACKFTVSNILEETITTYYILTNESGVILTNEDGDQLSVRI